eukprot:GHVO01029641.1.p2 GENE.GHVO01029641.1~~GHVO01029641.1.p2  ORF type:complete len:101 (+),score=13.84 GHVO01029641.1:48-350(+)
MQWEDIHVRWKEQSGGGALAYTHVNVYVRLHMYVQTYVHIGVCIVNIYTPLYDTPHSTVSYTPLHCMCMYSAHIRLCIYICDDDSNAVMDVFGPFCLPCT